MGIATDMAAWVRGPGKGRGAVATRAHLDKLRRKAAKKATKKTKPRERR